jgi:hypothetical protein
MGTQLSRARYWTGDRTPLRSEEPVKLEEAIDKAGDTGAEAIDKAKDSLHRR